MFLRRILVRLFLAALLFYPLTGSATHKVITAKDRSSILVSPYLYPIENSWVATFSTVFMMKPSNEFGLKTIPIVFHPERRLSPKLGSKSEVTIAFFKQRQNPSAPMVFLIPGIGGNSRYPKTIYIAEMLYRAGLSVVTLPATMSAQFSLGISQTGYPGYSPRDAEDMLEFMKLVDNRLRNEEGIAPCKYGIMGFSLGALDSGFIAKLDLDRHYFNFDRVLMINPPIQKANSIGALDRLLHQRGRLSAEDLLRLESDEESDQRISMEFATEPIFEPVLGDFTPFAFGRKRGLMDSEIAWMIGANFRRSLANVILASQEIDAFTHATTNARRPLRQLSHAEAFRYSYKKYVDDILFEAINTANDRSVRFQTAEQLVQASDLRAILPHLSANDREWAIFHNQDDFIFHPGDLEYLSSTGSASRVYPLGGHIGNIWFKQNRHDMIQFMRPLLR